MVFVNCQNETYILLLSSTGRGGIFFTEPGGKLECRLTVEENAIKELFEETFATLRVDDLS
jgi:ADP-ribose pyrophosphatase YjhB (NUDIX family)